MKQKVNHRVFCVIGLIVLLNVLFSPPVRHRKYRLEPGAVAEYDIIAPYNFFVYKTPAELAAERADIVRRIPPIFEINPAIPEQVSNRIMVLSAFLDSMLARRSRDTTIAILQREWAMRRELAEYVVWNNHRFLLQRLQRGLSDVYARGVLDAPPINSRIIAIQTRDREIVETVDRLYTMSSAESLLTVQRNGLFRELVQYFLQPNVVFSETKTQQRVDEVFVNIPRTKTEVLKGEIIVEKHRRIDEEVINKVKALEQTYVTIGAWEIFKTILLRNLLYAALLFLIFNYFRFSRLDLAKNKNLYFTFSLLAVFMLITRLLQAAGLFYLMPVSFFIFFLALYFNFQTAIFFTFLLSFFYSILASSLPLGFYLLIGGIVTSFSSQTLKTRISLYRPMLFIAVANVISVLFIHLSMVQDTFRFVHLIEGIASGILAGIGVGFFLPLMERIFDFTTELTLLELGNLNLPIFQEMSLKTPGTFHHSIVVGNLAEAGATAINADPVLARVGAYYHDIGKLDKPDYFIENQIGVKNPHDNLKPHMSALIIISHIREGVEMARRMTLPKKIIDIIAEHHGTTLLDLFYRRAMHADPNVKADDFSYPGPKPKSKEAALVMLADSVEAAARGERNISTVKLKKILKDNFDKKFNEGQLDECPLNRHDLEQIKTAFLPVLNGVFHPRVGSESPPATS